MNKTYVEWRNSIAMTDIHEHICQYWIIYQKMNIAHRDCMAIKYFIYFRRQRQRQRQRQLIYCRADWHWDRTMGCTMNGKLFIVHLTWIRERYISYMYIHIYEYMRRAFENNDAHASGRWLQPYLLPIFSHSLFSSCSVAVEHRSVQQKNIEMN